MRRVADWIDDHAALFIVVGLFALGWLWFRVGSDEHNTKREAEHTRTVQVQGGPVAVCLLEVMKNVAPLLLKIPSVEQPLDAYVRLQSKRYPGIRCPEKP